MQNNSGAAAGTNIGSPGVQATGKTKKLPQLAKDGRSGPGGQFQPTYESGGENDLTPKAESKLAYAQQQRASQNKSSSHMQTAQSAIAQPYLNSNQVMVKNGSRRTVNGAERV